ncbi:protein CMSS1 [Bombina bombina]|uniref:protein CMSS1 n=1 Tax=Bombina bombina TaxID=8345 RepID=UPI00235AD65C|nr:protein CMSS1 [Bombina bombina]
MWMNHIRKCTDLVDDDVKSEEKTKEVAQKRKKVPSNKSPPKKKKKQDPTQTEPEKNADTTSKKKRRKKKTISDVLATSVPKAGAPEDLQNMILQHFQGKRSVIEMEELMIPDSCFLTSNDLTHTPSSYLKEICPKWSKLSKNHKEKKSVLILIVCSSAIRALELIKLIKAFKGDTKIMKMFAKHIKVAEQIKFLEKNVIHLGVGTPARIKALIEKDGLTLESLKYVVFDWNWRDQKLRRMMDIPEVKLETLGLLEAGIISVCKTRSVKLGLF